MHFQDPSVCQCVVYFCAAAYARVYLGGGNSCKIDYSAVAVKSRCVGRMAYIA